MPYREDTPPIPETLRRDYPLEHDEVVVLDADGANLENKRSMNRQFGISVPLIGKVAAGAQDFFVLDTRESRHYDSPLMLVDKTFRRGSSAGFKGIWQDEPLSIGRRFYRERFDYHPTISVDHFALTYDGISLAIKNGRPTNETLVSGDIIGDHEARSRRADNLRDSFTHAVHEQMQNRFDYGTHDPNAPYGYDRNHPIIGRLSTSVKNGIYATNSSEAVIVDDKSRIMQKTAAEMLNKFERKFGENPTVPIQSVLEFIKDYTRLVMPYDLDGSEVLSRPHYGHNGIIGLSNYLDRRVGVCRHQALVSAFIVETLIDKNYLPGTPGVERNHDLDANGAHAWAIYRSPEGFVYVIDPAQNFVGTKAQARAEGRWKYELTADR